MAFQQNNIRAFGKDNNNDSWKADAFINLHIPFINNEGEPVEPKVGALNLKCSNDVGAQLIELFRNNPEEAAERFKNSLIIKFREATPATEGGKLAI